MKSIIKLIIITLVVVTTVYMATAFILVDINCFNWSMGCRLAVVVVSAVMLIPFIVTFYLD
jgi:hypothetical protein